MSDLDSAQTESSPERFDPEDMSGGLMEAEHRARYWWALQWVAGKRVLDAGCGTGYGAAMLADGRPEALVGVDISDEALTDARQRLGDDVELVRADVRELPFDPESFDVVVCFEVIEHIDRQADALAELKRVLRPGGVLLISSPNRDVYTPGNPHHVREYRPEELRSELEARFQHVQLHRQHPWLASALLPDEALGNGHAEQALAASIGERLEPGSETYTIAVASDVEIANPPGVIVIGNDFEVRWWHDQVDQLARARHRSAREAAELRQEVAELGRRLLESEQTAARALELEHSLEELEAEYARVAERLAHCERVIEDMKSSISWRLTAPLRRVKTLLKR
jgi:ubiquinone/menaquinone biosynthesis C-methylase UbiE